MRSGLAGEIRTDNNHAGYYELYYHQTRLARIRYVSFDDHKKSMVAPKWKPRGAGRFYFYEADSIAYAGSAILLHRPRGRFHKASHKGWGDSRL